MSDAKIPTDDVPTGDVPTDEVPTDDLDKANDILAEWAARSAADNDALVERLAGMGYDVRGKSEEEIAEVLRHPPTSPTASPAPEGA